MFGEFLKKNIESQASYVEYGYGQVEPNHLSAQRTGQIYAQLPADADIDVLEQGQFVKYDYASEVVNFTGAGEWMLVYNEIKLYRENQLDCEFAMKKSNYNGRIYSPFDANLNDTNFDLAANLFGKQSRYYDGLDSTGESSVTIKNLEDTEGEVEKTYNFDDVTVGTVREGVASDYDYYEPHYNADPYHIERRYKAKRMPEGTTMVPRVFKTNVGDIFTTNMINATELEVGDKLKVGADGILMAGEDDAMTWQVVKVYTMPDHQKGVKIMRIK